MNDKSDKRSLFAVIKRIFFAQITIILTSVICVVVFSIVTGQAGSFIFSFLAGCLGGSVSLVRRLNRKTEETMQQIAFSWVTTLMPLLYGGIMAIVIYLLFMSQILTGDSGGGLFTSNLFPNFKIPKLNNGEVMTVPFVLEIRPDTVLDAGKLLVWSFLSGYSEKFVTGILSSLEKRSSGVNS